MLTTRSFSHYISATRRRLLIGGLVALLCLVLPATAWADSGSEQCVQCHSAEATAWQGSPHAQAMNVLEDSFRAHGEVLDEDSECLACHTALGDLVTSSGSHDGVTCEACHGSYVAGHPEDGVMQLHVDSSTCQNCHNTTYGQWHETAHAEANVQCTSCHVPHTQQTRFEGETLCGSCHRDVIDVGVHHGADVQCIDCHFSSQPVSDTTTDISVMTGGSAPNHSFQLPAQVCTDCHSQSIHHTTSFIEVANTPNNSDVSVVTSRAKELAYELEEAKKTNRSLRNMSVIGTGLGLGVGAMLGVIFTLIVGFVIQGRMKK